jgi:hypothetical protein
MRRQKIYFFITLVFSFFVLPIFPENNTDQQTEIEKLQEEVTASHAEFKGKLEPSVDGAKSLIELLSLNISDLERAITEKQKEIDDLLNQKESSGDELKKQLETLQNNLELLKNREKIFYAKFNEVSKNAGKATKTDAQSIKDRHKNQAKVVETLRASKDKDYIAKGTLGSALKLKESAKNQATLPTQTKSSTDDLNQLIEDALDLGKTLDETKVPTDTNIKKTSLANLLNRAEEFENLKHDLSPELKKNLEQEEEEKKQLATLKATLVWSGVGKDGTRIKEKSNKAEAKKLSDEKEKNYIVEAWLRRGENLLKLKDPVKLKDEKELLKKLNDRIAKDNLATLAQQAEIGNLQAKIISLEPSKPKQEN